MRKIYICLFLVCCSLVVEGQNKKVIDSLLTSLKTALADTQKIKIYNSLALQYTNSLDLSNIDLYTDKAIQLAQQNKYMKGVAQAYIISATAYMKKGEYDKAQWLFGKALKVATIHQCLKEKANTTNGLGILSFHQGKLLDAISYFEQSLSTHQALGNKLGVARSYSNIASMYQERGLYFKALDTYFQSLELSKEIGSKRGESYNYYNIALIYKTQKRFEKALEYFKKSLKIKQEMGATLDLISTYNDLGNVYIELKQTEKAFKHLFKALSIAKEVNSTRKLLHCYLSLGNNYIKLKQYAKALLYLSKSLAYEEKGDKLEFARIYVALGKTHYYLKNYAIAEEYLQKGMHLSRQIELSKNIKEAARVFALVYEAQGNYKSAYINHQLFKKMTDSLLNKENTTKIARLESQFEFEQEKDSIKFAQEKKQLAFDAEIKARNARQILTYIGLGLVTLLLVVVLVFFRDKQRSNQKLNLLNAELAESNEEIKVAHEEVQVTNEEIKTVNEKLIQTLEIVQSQRDDIISSINYAQRIQKAILPSFTYIKYAFPESFILYKPCEIVSGDFYWFASVEPSLQGKAVKHFMGEQQVLVAADCTGHGVPGAFMTMLGSQALTDLVVRRNIVSPSEILNTLDKNLKSLLKRNITLVDDGMDITICVIDKEAQELKFAGARNPIILVQEGQLREIKGDLYSINGYRTQGEQAAYTEHTIDISVPTTLYMYSDGYQDQFGGNLGKKFMKKRFLELIHTIADRPIEEQQQQLELTLNDWMGDEKQVDDILVMGVKL